MSKQTVNVYVFGAGASAHLGGPLTEDFLSKGFNLLCRAGSRDITTESFFKIARLLDTLYGSNVFDEIGQAVDSGSGGIPPAKIPQVTAEELLSFLEIALGGQETWLPFAELREAFYDFIFETLESLTRGLGQAENQTAGAIPHCRRNCYGQLVDNLLAVTEKNCFITFNYDLLLDEALSCNQHHLLGDYNLDFTTVHDFPIYRRISSQNRDERDVDILKLHGSLNWAHCPVCREIHLTHHRTYKSTFQKKCAHCKGALTPLLIPPAYRKHLERYGLGRLWDKAGEILSGADNITIIGYSFPDGDAEVKWLLKRSLARGQKKPRLILAEPSPRVRQKITGLFGNTIQEVVIFKDFEQYCSASACPLPIPGNDNKRSLHFFPAPN